MKLDNHERVSDSSVVNPSHRLGDESHPPMTLMQADVLLWPQISCT